MLLLIGILLVRFLLWMEVNGNWRVRVSWFVEFVGYWFVWLCWWSGGLCDGLLFVEIDNGVVVDVGMWYWGVM